LQRILLIEMDNNAFQLIQVYLVENNLKMMATVCLM